MIPTHQTIKELTKGKLFTPKQAEAIVEAVGQTERQLATTEDVASVRVEIKDLQEATMEIRREIPGIRKDLELLEGRTDKKFARMETTLTVRMVGALGLLFVALKYAG